MTFIAYAGCISVLFLLALRWPATAVAAALLMFSFEQWAQASNGYFFQNNWLTNYLFLAVILTAWTTTIIRQGIPKVAPDGSVVLILALYAWSFISILWSSDPALAMDLWQINGPYHALMVIVTPMLIRKTSDLGKTFTAYIFLGTTLAAMLLFTVEWNGRYLVIPGMLNPFDSNPNEIGKLGALLLVFSMTIRLDSKTKMARGLHLHVVMKVARWFIVALAVAIAIRSEARGQLLGAAAAVLFAVWAKGKRKNVGTVLGVFAALAMIAVLSYFVFGYLIDDQNRWTVERISSDIYGRFAASIDLLRAWIADTPAFLFGLGNSSSYSIVGFYPHVVPVEILAEAGLIGFFLFLAIMYKCAANLIALFRLVRDRIALSYTICLAALLIVESLLYLKQGSFITSPSLFLCVVLIAHTKRFEIARHRAEQVRLNSKF